MLQCHRRKAHQDGKVRMRFPMTGSWLQTLRCNCTQAYLDGFCEQHAAADLQTTVTVYLAAAASPRGPGRSTQGTCRGTAEPPTGRPGCSARLAQLR